MEALTVPAGFRIERGLLWPASDVHCAPAVFGSLRDLDRVLTRVPHHGVAVQAGGNCGVWARALAGLYERVITFEPDQTNFRCLVHNTVGFDNILALPMAVGEKSRTWIGIDGDPTNVGAHQVTSGMVAPMMRLDDLALPDLDLLYLDIEGKELDALAGAVDTIEEYHPVIAFEDKGLSKRYGHEKGEAEKFLAGALGYRVVDRFARDVVMVWDGSH